MQDFKSTRQEMIEGIQHAYEVAGRTPCADGRAHPAYNSLRREGDVTASIIIAEFGSWNTALKMAGVPLNKKQPPSGMGKKTYEDSDLLDAVEEAIEACGGKLTGRAYEEWRKQYVGEPCAALIIRRLRKTIGTWSDIVEFCGGRSGHRKTPPGTFRQ